MKKVFRIILFAIVIVILIATFKFIWESSLPETATYEITSPSLGTINNTITVAGNIEPRNETAVKPVISGIVKQIYKKVGDYVSQGDIIATLNIIPDAAIITAAESNLNIAEINLDRESKSFTRQQELYKDGIIPKNEFERDEARYNSAIEERDNAEDNLQIAKTGSSRRSNRVDNTRVRTNSSGTILEIPVKEGNYVVPTNPFNTGITIAIVADMNDLIFRGNIDESDIGKIWIGMPINISIGAIPNEKIEAVLEDISPQGKKESGSVLFEIKAALKPPKTMQSLMRAQYSANADIIISQAKNAIVIPESSVEFNRDGSTYVYVLKTGTGASDKQIFTKSRIEIGIYDGTNVEVTSGLEFNDKIRGNLIDQKSK